MEDHVTRQAVEFASLNWEDFDALRRIERADHDAFFDHENLAEYLQASIDAEETAQAIAGHAIAHVGLAWMDDYDF